MNSRELAYRLEQTYLDFDANKRADWKRGLPLCELLFERKDRAKREGFGEGTTVYHNCYTYGKVKVGRNTWIGPFTLLDGSGDLEIGSNCSISAGVQIYTHSAVEWAVTNSKASYWYEHVIIGDCVFVGPNTVISMGVEIKSHVIIGANSFVDRDLPPYTLCYGNPCRPRRRIAVEGDEVIKLEAIIGE